MTSRVTDYAILPAITLMLVMAFTGFVKTASAQDSPHAQSSDQQSSKDVQASERYYEGMLEVQRGNDDAAIEKFLEVLKIDPSSYNTMVILGKVYGKQGRFEESEQTFREAIKLKPESPHAYDSLLSLYLFIKKPNKAVETGEEALANGVPDNFILDLGWAYYQAGMFEKAEQRYLKELTFRKGVDLFAPNRNLGILYYATGKNEKALEYYKVAEKIGRKPKEVPLLTAIVYASVGQDESVYNSLAIFKRRNKNPVKDANRYIKKLLPHSKVPSLAPYFFNYDQEAVKKRRGEK